MKDRRTPHGIETRSQAPPASGPSRRFAVRAHHELLWRLALLALCGIAAAWRLAYLARLRHTQFAATLDADARIYWDWSESILRHGPAPPSPFFLAPLYPYMLALVRTI